MEWEEECQSLENICLNTLPDLFGVIYFDMNRKNPFFLFFFVVVCLFGQSCDNSQEVKRRAPDVSDIDVEAEIVRFDRALFDLDTLNIGQGLIELEQNYPEFSQLYFGPQLTGFKKPDKDSFQNTVANFLKDPNIQKLQGDIENTFGDLNAVSKDLTQAVKYLKYYFPDFKTPVFYTLNSEYGFQSFIFNEKNRDGIGIGLDMFLGKSLDYKSIDPRNPSFSDYLVASYNEDYIVRKSMAVVAQELLGDRPGKRFIDQMIYNGKKLYLLEHLLPSSHDTIITEFSQAQLNWLNSNQMEIWSFFLDKNIMYETNFFEINKYLNPSPHSPGMPKEAPGNSANFMGLQIVKSFMKQNPEMNLQELIAFRDAQKLLELAKFKPKRR